MLGTAWAKMECITYCFKYLEKLVNQEDFSCGTGGHNRWLEPGWSLLVFFFGRLHHFQGATHLQGKKGNTIKEA